MDFINISIIDIIDITLVALIIWQIYRVLRGTSAMMIFIGISILYIIWALVRIFNMELMSFILSQILGVGFLAIIVVFQQEVRQYLLIIGNKLTHTSNGFLQKFVGIKKVNLDNRILLEITNAVMNMSTGKVGALIVFERTSNLETITETGDQINADISARLIETIFFKNTPLHDGAMIIANNKIKYARCVLPVSDNITIPANYGLRHRAAAGVTEQTDAFAIVVSEQTGKISIVDKGIIQTLKPENNISDLIREKMTL